MKDYELVDFHSMVIEVFGSFVILDSISAEDMPEFYRFVKIVSNYIHMSRIGKVENL